MSEFDEQKVKMLLNSEFEVARTSANNEYAPLKPMMRSRPATANYYSSKSLKVK